VAGLVFQIIILWARWVVFEGQGGFVLSQCVGIYGWPIALTVGLVAAISHGQRLAVAAGYLTVGIALSLIDLLRNPEAFNDILVEGWLEGAASLVLLVFMHRRIRAVAPFVFIFLVLGIMGALIVFFKVTSWMSYYVDHTGADDSSVHMGHLISTLLIGSLNWLGFGWIEIAIFLLVLGFLPFGLIGWWLLKWTGRRYQRKDMSDQSLTLDVMWLMYATIHSSQLAEGGWVWMLTGLVAFGGYKVVAWVGWWLVLQPSRTGGVAPMLLVLRVFSLGRQSERLYDDLSKLWLREGSIALIAGPDLAPGIVQPHEFLEYVGGRLSRRFVRNEADLEQSLSQMDTRPDPDGHHRVNEFFCFADTWKMTLRRLLRASSAVLMDLRSFSPLKQGCLYELEQLLEVMPLERLVLVVDDTTDEPFLQHTLRTLWQRLPEHSLNRQTSVANVRIFKLSSQGAAQISVLFKLLLCHAIEGGHEGLPAWPTRSPRSCSSFLKES
jgi:hypothetical protein